MPYAEDRAFLRRALETSIRIGLVLFLVVWCFAIARPFLPADRLGNHPRDRDPAHLRGALPRDGRAKVSRRGDSRGGRPAGADRPLRPAHDQRGGVDDPAGGEGGGRGR